jgi:signal peptidase I
MRRERHRIPTMHELVIRQSELADVATEVLARGGLFCFKASGSSMFPFIRSGALVYIEPMDTGLLKVGDVVLYRRGRSIAVHRVVGEKRQDGVVRILIRGDADSGPPEAVPPRDIIGLVAGIDNGGGFVSLRTGAIVAAGRCWILVTPVAQLLVRSISRLLTFARKAVKG